MPDQPPAPALKKLDLTIARLRLLVAEVTARGASIDAQRRTYLDQRDKLVLFSLYGDSTLDNALAMLADVEDRLHHVEATSRSLAAIRKRAEEELESLQLTKGVEEAKSLMTELQSRQSEPQAQIQAEIARLQALINEASERAAKNIEKTQRR